MKNFVLGNQFNRINRLGSVRIIMRSWSMQLLNIDPLNTFVARESERDSGGSLDEAWDVNPDMPVDGLS